MSLRLSLAVLMWLIMAPPTRACELALVLAVDVSGSVDSEEYDVQRNGLAAALRDGAVAEALVQGKARIALVQWTGSSRQRQTIPWTEIRSFADLEALALAIETDERAWRIFSTAIGEALEFGIDLLRDGPECKRRVIDVSGDGVSNEGAEPRGLRPRLEAEGITVNALVIEGADDDLTGYFYENVISGPGAFVTTANGFQEYPAKIRQKLLREITKQVADAE